MSRQHEVTLSLRLTFGEYNLAPVVHCSLAGVTLATWSPTREWVQQDAVWDALTAGQLWELTTLARQVWLENTERRCEEAPGDTAPAPLVVPGLPPVVRGAR